MSWIEDRGKLMQLAKYPNRVQMQETGMRVIKERDKLQAETEILKEALIEIKCRTQGRVYDIATKALNRVEEMEETL